jgi:hypothetical protein
VWTTAADYAAFVVDIQHSLRGEDGRVLTPASAELMVSPHEAPQYGLGVFQRGGGDGARYVSHLGDGPGFVAGFTMDVIGGRGMVVLTNGRGGIELVREISRAIANVKGWPYLLPGAVTPIDPGDETRAGLAGRYRVGDDGEVVLERRGDELWLNAPSLGEVELYFTDSSTMVCRERAGEIAVVRTFRRRRGGRRASRGRGTPCRRARGQLVRRGCRSRAAAGCRGPGRSPLPARARGR